MDIYRIVLALHNLLRWVVLIFAILAVVRAYRGWLGKREWSQADERAGTFFGAAMDLQVLLGLLLYFVFSPITTAALGDFGTAMGNPTTRFFALEHILYMIVATALVHAGSVMARRAELNRAKFRTAAILYSLAVLVIIIAIPWSRPLFRLG